MRVTWAAAKSKLTMGRLIRANPAHSEITASFSENPDSQNLKTTAFRALRIVRFEKAV